MIVTLTVVLLPEWRRNGLDNDIVLELLPKHRGKGPSRVQGVPDASKK